MALFQATSYFSCFFLFAFNISADSFQQFFCFLSAGLSSKAVSKLSEQTCRFSRLSFKPLSSCSLTIFCALSDLWKYHGYRFAVFFAPGWHYNCSVFQPFPPTCFALQLLQLLSCLVFLSLQLPCFFLVIFWQLLWLFCKPAAAISTKNCSF